MNELAIDLKGYIDITNKSFRYKDPVILKNSTKLKSSLIATYGNIGEELVTLADGFLDALNVKGTVDGSLEVYNSTVTAYSGDKDIFKSYAKLKEVMLSTDSISQNYAKASTELDVLEDVALRSKEELQSQSTSFKILSDATKEEANRVGNTLSIKPPPVTALTFPSSKETTLKKKSTSTVSKRKFQTTERVNTSSVPVTPIKVTESLISSSATQLLDRDLFDPRLLEFIVPKFRESSSSSYFYTVTEFKPVSKSQVILEAMKFKLYGDSQVAVTRTLGTLGEVYINRDLAVTVPYKSYIKTYKNESILGFSYVLNGKIRPPINITVLGNNLYQVIFDLDCIIRVQFSTSVSTSRLFNQMSITNYTETHNEKFQIRDTLSEGQIASVFGSKPEIWSISGKLLNDAYSKWYPTFRDYWESELRASILVEQSKFAVLFVPSVSIYLSVYPIALTMLSSSVNSVLCAFNMAMYVKTFRTLPEIYATPANTTIRAIKEAYADYK